MKVLLRLQIFKEARSKLERDGRPEAADLNIDLGLVYRYCNLNSYYNSNSFAPFLLGLFHKTPHNIIKCFKIYFSLGGPFPQLETITSDNDQIIQSLIQFLEQRINKRNILRADLQKKREKLNFSKSLSRNYRN